jgi:uncharacterized protein (TIGR03435 family)
MRRNAGYKLRKLLKVLAILPACCASIALSQEASQPSANANSKLPEFEVASIRPSKPGPGEMNGLRVYPGGRVVGRGCNFKYLVMLAFNVQPFQVTGGPSWTDFGRGDRFDIEAIAPASSWSAHSNPAIPKNFPTDEERQMLLTLLIDRFQFKFHRETREGSVYLLTKGDKELKLLPPKDKSAYSWAGGIDGGLPGLSGLRGTNISMPQLAVRMSEWFRRPVLDRTGLVGSYDFEYRTGEDENDRNADWTSSVLISIKGLGLKLTPGKGPVETVVIDSAEQPSLN